MSNEKRKKKLVHGSDCSIILRTSQHEIDVPYSEESIREDILVLQEEAALDGDGISKGLKKSNGVTGCVVTPLTLHTVPTLLSVAFGLANNPVFVSGTRNMYKTILKLVPCEDSITFDLIQDRNTKIDDQDEKRKTGKLFEHCRVKYFELRIWRDKNIKLKMDMQSDVSSRNYFYDEIISQGDERLREEKIHGENVSYEFTDSSSGQMTTESTDTVYAVTIQTMKEHGFLMTGISIKRVLEKGREIPPEIEELVITAPLLLDSYEDHRFGTFCIKLKNLVLVSDQIIIETHTAVLGVFEYRVMGSVTAEVFQTGSESL
jgi:hypothetical protein